MSFQSGIPFHETGTFISRRTFLPDEQYGIALDNLVKGCTDILLLHPDGKRIFLGKRCVQPQPDWWFMGGRILPGETPLDSCCRLLDREMKLYISPYRLQYICTQTFAFSMRQQVPQDHGTTDVQLCYLLQLVNDTEVSKVILDPMEYNDGAWVLPTEIVNGNYHPALKYAIKCMLTAQALQTLQECVESEGGSDAEIANLTREFLTRRKDVNSNMMVTSEEEGGEVASIKITTTTTMCNKDYVLDSKELNYQTTVQTKY